MSKAKKKNKTFAFATHLPLADFKRNLREAVQNSGHLLYEDTQNGFDLGIERGGHSGGYWYAATMTETEGGAEMRGRSSTAPTTRTESCGRTPKGRRSANGWASSSS
jgi:hypothetical protein